MAELHYKDGGTWRKARELHYRDGGTWRKLKEAWYRDGGVWRKVFSSVGVLPVLTDRTVGSAVLSRIDFLNDGTLQTYIDDSSTIYTATIAGQWLPSSPGAVSSAEAGAYDVLFSYVSGPNTSSGTTTAGGANKYGAAYGVWLNLAASQFITVAAREGTISGAGGGTLVFDAAIRPAGGGATLASARFTLICST